MLSRGRLREVAFAEGFHPLAEGLLRAGREEDHADALRGVLGEAAGEPEQGDAGAAVVVGAGDDRTHADVGHRRGASDPEDEAELGERTVPAERAERRQQWAAEDRRHQRRTGVGALDQSEPVADLGQRRVEDEPGVGCVVVGDEDDGALGGGVAELGDDVVGGAGRQRPAQPALAGREVVSDAGGADRAEQAPQRPSPAQRGGGAEGSEGGAEPKRPPESAVGGLGLDPCPGAELGEAGDQPLGGAALAVRGRGAFDLLQLFEPLPQPIRFVRHGRGR